MVQSKHQSSTFSQILLAEIVDFGVHDTDLSSSNDRWSSLGMFSSWTRHWSLASTFSVTHLWRFWNSWLSEHSTFRAQVMSSLNIIPGPGSLVHSRDAICNTWRLMRRSWKTGRVKAFSCNYVVFSSWYIETAQEPYIWLLKVTCYHLNGKINSEINWSRIHYSVNILATKVEL